MKTPDYIIIEESGWSRGIEFQEGKGVSVHFGKERSRDQGYRITGISYADKKIRRLELTKVSLCMVHDKDTLPPTQKILYPKSKKR